jgi:hypothetical protein
MNPATIIKQAAADGVSLILSPAGTIKATGNGDAVNRWLPLTREHKPGVLAALQEAANDDTRPDPTAEARRQRVLAMLAEHPEARYAVLTDTHADPDAVLLTLAIRRRATCELRIPRDRYDPFLLLDLIERHSATVH